MLNSTMTLKPEDIDESKDYKLIHTTMQLKIKMKTDTILIIGSEMKDKT